MAAITFRARVAPLSRVFSKALAIALAGAAALAGCGSNELLLQADRQNITAGGIDYAVITAVFGKGGNTVAGQTLHFETTAGSFSEQDPDLQEVDISTDATGQAQIQLFSSASPGTATVTVTHEDLNSDITTVASVSVRFGKPTGNTIPLAESVRLVCDAANIGALRRPVPDLRVTCSLNAQTADGRTIPLSALDPMLFAEAGTLLKERDEFDDKLTLVYTPKGGNAAPKDVKPVAAIREPSVTVAGKVHNPRDGLVTLLAVVTAQEQFQDDNGNGVYDDGEPFIDSPEPFLDEDDDGQRDEGERFVDVDHNGQWDAGNGIWDREARVMAIYKILWTGPLANDITGSNEASSHIVAQQRTPLTVTVQALAIDENINPVAGFPANYDQLEWSVEGTGVEPGSPTEVPVKNSYGFDFDRTAATEVERWRPLGNSFKPEPFLLELRAQSGDTTLSAVVSAQLVVSPGPRGPDDFLDQITERIEYTLPIGQ